MTTIEVGTQDAIDLFLCRRSRLLRIILVKRLWMCAFDFCDSGQSLSLCLSLSSVFQVDTF
jgi:hypothetical protein